MSIKQRVERLERLAPVIGNVEKAHAVLTAWNMVTCHPERATDADRTLLADNDWGEALCISIAAVGGLEAAIMATIGSGRRGYETNAP